MGIGAFNGGTNNLPNCCVMRISPATYEQVFAPYDRVGCASAEKAGHPGSGIHHCGTFDRYTPVYRALGRFSWMEIGMDSDIRLAMETFPEAETVSFIIGRGTPDANIAAVVETLKAAR
jgi:hypothetical protein